MSLTLEHMTPEREAEIRQYLEDCGSCQPYAMRELLEEIDCLRGFCSEIYGDAYPDRDANDRLDHYENYKKKNARTKNYINPDVLSGGVRGGK